MSKIRDFFYNCSDIFVALIILGLAGFLIWTRVNIIMAYPDSYDGNITTEISELSEEEEPEGFISNRDLITPTDSAIQNNEASESAVTTSGEGITGEVHEPVTPPDAPTRITVGIPVNATAQQVGDILYSSGLVSDPQEFLDMVSARGITKFISGSLSLESSSTLEQILNAVSKE